MPELTLTPTPPFDLDLTASHKTYYQREYGADTYSDGVYRRTFEIGGALVLGAVRSTGAVEEPALAVEVGGDGLPSGVERAVRDEMSRILNVDVDLRPFYETVRDDRFLLEATHGLYGLHPPQTPSVFEALVMAVVGQQISGLVARAIRARVVRELGPPFVVDGDTVHAFPQPLAFLRAGEERLRGLGLSGRKAEYILDIASRADDQPSFFDRLRKVTNQEVVEELTRIRGVGQWTAQWVLLGALGRTDAFPAGDLALRSLLSEAYFGGRSIHEKEALEFAGKQWGDYAGLATTYLFAYIRRRRMENERRDIVQGA